jgi:hypothetical protein
MAGLDPTIHGLLLEDVDGPPLPFAGHDLP